MAGGLMQLVAYTGQDIYLAGNPQITFFDSIWNSIEQGGTEQGSTGTKKPQTFSEKINSKEKINDCCLVCYETSDQVMKCDNCVFLVCVSCCTKINETNCVHCKKCFL